MVEPNYVPQTILALKLSTTMKLEQFIKSSYPKSQNRGAGTKESECVSIFKICRVEHALRASILYQF